MTVNYTPSNPVAGASRSSSSTEVERWSDYRDTIGDVNSRLIAKLDKSSGVVNDFLDYTAIADPATPAAGFLRSYVKKISDRAMLKVISPAGRSSADING